MPIERTAGGENLIDVLDRVLDKGVVVDAWARPSVDGIDLVTVESKVVVAELRRARDGPDHDTSTPAAEDVSIPDSHRPPGRPEHSD
jgi:gas vesicle structural protein